MITVFLKSTFLPFESVICPSSSTCRRILNTSPCAFSISSNKRTLYGRRRTCSESCPPSSYPTYPGGEPINLDTLCFSIYSDISTRIIAFSSPKSASASALDNSVLPTPVGPKNIKEPIGLFGSFKPTRPRLIAFASIVTASSCPMTLFFKVSSNPKRRWDSLWLIRVTGIFVQEETTAATSFSVTVIRLTDFFSSHNSRSFASFVSIVFCFVLFVFALRRFPSASASSFLLPYLSNCSSNVLISSDIVQRPTFFFEAASSITSIALSGRKRSLIYRSDNSTAA